MKRGTKKSYVPKDTKKSPGASTSKHHKEQIKLQTKQEVIEISSESDDTDSDYAEFLKTYNPEEEYLDSS
ncbi:hypothetical protein A2U01_0052047, partial [Trifolium medium]|nr:hypothetical protein [Trifolium medium]